MAEISTSCDNSVADSDQLAVLARRDEFEEACEQALTNGTELPKPEDWAGDATGPRGEELFGGYLGRLFDCLRRAHKDVILEEYLQKYPDLVSTVTRVFYDRPLHDRYKIERKLGEGGQANVYLARDMDYQDQEVAIKVFHVPCEQLREQVRGRFKEEARRLKFAKHALVVPMLDEFEADDRYCIVLEYIKGQTLKEKLRQEGRMEPKEAGRIVQQLAEAIEVVHTATGSHGGTVVHGDLKPANIMIDGQGTPRILDFGFAALTDNAPGAGGTFEYMSPEKATAFLQDGTGMVDPRSDVFALGAILFTALIGKPPFESPKGPKGPLSSIEAENETYERFLRSIIANFNVPCPAARSRDPSIPPQLDEIIRHCLDKNPVTRTQTAGELASSLKTWLEALDQDTPWFVRNWRGRDQLPQQLRWPDSDLFVNVRAAEFAALKSQLIPKRVVPILGPPESGKTALVQHFFSDVQQAQALARRFGQAQVALIYMDLASSGGPNPAARALFDVLGQRKFETLRDIDEEQTNIGAAIEKCLGYSLRGRSPVVVIENAQSTLLDPVASTGLESVIRSVASHNGASALVANAGTLDDKSTAKYRIEPAVRLDALSTEETKALIETNALVSECSQDPELATQVSRNIAGVADLMFPGIIIAGAQSARCRAADDGITCTSDEVTNRILEVAADYVKTKLQDLAAAGCAEPAIIGDTLTSFGTLLFCAIVARQPFTPAAFQDGSLGPASIHALQNRGVLDERCGSFRLTPLFSKVLRLRLVEILRVDDDRATERHLAAGLDRLLGTMAESLPAEGTGVAKRAEEALTWLKEKVPAATILQDTLRLYMSEAIDDRVSPFDQKEVSEFAERVSGTPVPTAAGRLRAALALLWATRFEKDGQKFLPLLRNAVEAAASDGVQVLDGQTVRILDAAAYIASRRYRKFEELLPIRTVLVPKLIETLNDTGRGDLALVKWATSWFLNSARLCVALGEWDQASDLVQHARHAMAQFPQPISSFAREDALDLHDRLCRVASLLDSPNRRERLKDSFNATAQALELSFGHPRWLRRHLRATRRLLEDTADSHERAGILQETRDRLVQVFQCEKIGLGPLFLRTQAAALVRDAAHLERDTTLRFEGAKNALQLLKDATGELEQMAQEGDSRGLLVLARTQAFFGHCAFDLNQPDIANKNLQEACKRARKALDVLPSLDSWDLYLRLLDQIKSARSFGWSIDQDEKPRINMPKVLRDAIAKFKTWEKEQVAGRLDGRLSLWCIQRKWQEQGGLESWAREQLSKDLEWKRLQPAQKRSHVASCHHQRLQQLNGIENRFGPFPELFIAFARLESQFQRLLALKSFGGTGACDRTPVFAVFERAARLLPDSWVMKAEEARFHRYVWNYGDAIKRYREAIGMASRSEERRELQVGLAETLLSSAVHGGQLDLGDGTIKVHSELVAEARKCLDGLTEFRNTMTEAAVLRDQIEFEAGGSVDWTRLEQTYDLIVKDDYVKTVLLNLNELQKGNPSFPEHLAEAVKAEFTSVDVLRSFGVLFLRRGERNNNQEEAVADARRAYFIFSACRVLERSFLSGEIPRTKYQRARAILVAANKARLANPLPLHLEGKRDGLAYAESLFDSVASRSVGMFNEEARRRKSETAFLRKTLST